MATSPRRTATSRCSRASASSATCTSATAPGSTSPPAAHASSSSARAAATSRRSRRTPSTRCARPCSTRSATAPASPTSRSPGCAPTCAAEEDDAESHPRLRLTPAEGRACGSSRRPSSACTSSASGCSSGSSCLGTTQLRAGGAVPRPASGSRPTRWACATRSTPTTSRRDRQHDAQVHARGPAAAERRVLLRARALDRRLRAGAAALPRRQGAGGARPGRRLDAALGHRAHRGRRVSGTFPVSDRGAEPRRAWWASCGSSATCAAAVYAEAALEGPAAVARAGESLPGAASPAPLLKPWQSTRCWLPLRAGLRHGDRGRPSCSLPAVPPAPGCRGARSCACRSSSPPACRCWTRSTARS